MRGSRPAFERPGLGVLTSLMQASVFLWPTAACWAKEAEEQDNIKRLLRELSEAHGPAMASADDSAYPMISKKFQ